MRAACSAAGVRSGGAYSCSGARTTPPAPRALARSRSRSGGRRPGLGQVLVQLLDRPGRAVRVDAHHRCDVACRDGHDRQRAQLVPERAARLVESARGALRRVDTQGGRGSHAHDPLPDADGYLALQPRAQLSLQRRLGLRGAQPADVDARHVDAGQRVLPVLQPADAERTRDARRKGDEEDCGGAEAMSPAATAEHEPYIEAGVSRGRAEQAGRRGTERRLARPARRRCRRRARARTAARSRAPARRRPWGPPRRFARV
jgi:hypothetical protein